ncbi:hypothetical protein DKT68_14530 [Micromonospora acroterricola]|uniref:GHMP kinase N-terminal domain-containing protein n=1 Tax=Micromonospora acroterricola TaxID=2202421 RepID=A0A317D1M3_9ACTN|nr:hypothetical protein [Micromonospora acroterricola]PWR08778.1 hypothetical protein DKT68_14530 [Micromonospora acroterricola]
MAAKSLIARAPVRVDLTGGYTDVPPFDAGRPNGTSVNIAITLYAWATFRDRRDGEPVADGFVEELRAACAGVLGLDRRRTRPMSVEVDVPAGCGLGTSAAQGVAMVRLLAADRGIPLNPKEVAEAAAAAERHLGIVGGWQDQYASSYGGANVVISSADGRHAHPLGPAFQAWAAARIVIALPATVRRGAALVEDVVRGYATHRVRASLGDLDRLAADLCGVIRLGAYASLPKLLERVREAQERLDQRIVDPDFLPCLESAGVSTAKPCGGGGAGAAWLIIEESARIPSIRAALHRAGVRTVAPAVDHQGAVVLDGRSTGAAVP